MIAGVLILFLLSGCASRELIVLLPDEKGETGALIVNTQQGETIQLNKAHESATLGGFSSSPKMLSQENIESHFQKTLAAQPRKPRVFIFSFAASSVTPKPEHGVYITEIVKLFHHWQVPEISISGHTDSKGGDRFNYPLSMKRAQTIRNSLIDQGIPQEKIEIHYFGSSNPLVPTQGDAIEPRNRRVEVVIR